MSTKIAIAGASGFIGQWFIERYHDQYDIIALSRSKNVKETRAGVEWRQVDLYSLSSTEKALKGADYAIYLVHSMAPSSHLNQSSFENTDLLMADNFARSAERCKLKQIIFIGGILPKDKSAYSRHLRSRFEVEKTLSSRRVPTTTLRAGIIIGPGGSSFEIIEKLVRRLPVMACPKWTKSYSQPIDISDVLKIINKSIGNAELYNRAIEIGGERKITYMDLLKLTAKRMGKKRLIFSIPFFTLGFSKLWVGFFSDSNSTFASPLVESLKHDMTINEKTKLDFGFEYTKIEDSIDKAIQKKLPGIRFIDKKDRIEKNTVRSVQRLPNPARKSVNWISKTYPRWLQNSFKYLIKTKEEDNRLQFRLFRIKLLELELIENRSDEKRRIFFIVGGRLAKRTDHGWLEFRSVLDNKFVIAAIHEFVPRLPWTIYKYTQALAHLFIMNRFGNYLAKKVKA